MGKTKEVTERFVDGIRLTCPICHHNQFWTRSTLMNTRGLTFFEFDWANKTATNYVCNQCGHVLWFMEKRG